MNLYIDKSQINDSVSSQPFSNEFKELYLKSKIISFDKNQTPVNYKVTQTDSYLTTINDLNQNIQSISNRKKPQKQKIKFTDFDIQEKNFRLTTTSNNNRKIGKEQEMFITENSSQDYDLNEEDLLTKNNNENNNNDNIINYIKDNKNNNKEENNTFEHKDYFQIIHAANLNLKMDNDRLKSDIIKKDEIIEQFEKLSFDCANKLELLENRENNFEIQQMKKQISYLKQYLNIIETSDVFNKVKENYDLYIRENYILKQRIDDLQKENNFLRIENQKFIEENNNIKKYCNALNETYSSKKGEITKTNFDYEIKQKQYLDNIMELRKLLKEKEDENYFLKMELKKYNH